MKKLTTLDKAVRKWGFEDPRTITIAFLEEEGAAELVEDLFKVLTEEEDK